MANDLVRVPKRAVATLIGGLTTVMVVPPILAGVFGSLALAVIVGVVSILFGLVGMSVLVSRWEIVLRRSPPAKLPSARLLKSGTKQ